MSDKLRMTPAALSAFCKGDIDNFIRAATPGGIEKQEAQEQVSLVVATTPRLPKIFMGLRLIGIDKFENDALICQPSGKVTLTNKSS